MKTPLAFDPPIFVTRPMMPDLHLAQQALAEIWATQQLTNFGPKHKNLARRISEFLGTPHASLCNNGTLALEVACKALKLTGEVITTPFTFPATTHALVNNQLTPVFGDIQRDYFTLDPTYIEELIGPNTCAIMPVHVFGHPCNVRAIADIAREHKLKVIYDAAHAFGVSIDDVPIGNFGDISVFSFHATKVFNTIEGGALTFSEPTLEDTIYYLTNFGFKNEEEIVGVGTNAKMNELQAAIGLLNLDLVPEAISRRKERSIQYWELLQQMPGLTLIKPGSNVTHNYAYLPIIVDAKKFGVSRDTLYVELRKFGVFARKYFYPLCSAHACYTHLPSARRKFLPIAHEVASQVLCLPLYPALSTDSVNRICEIMRYIQETSGGRNV